MKKNTFDYKGAKKEGYTDDEITEFLSEKHPDFDFESALNEGHSHEEVNKYLSEYKKPKSTSENAARLVQQYALGAAENSALPYEVATAINTAKPVQIAQNRERLIQEIGDLQEKKYLSKLFGNNSFSERDQEQLDYNTDLVKNPKKLEETIQDKDYSIRGLTEKATGLDLKPEGFLEKALNWMGFLKDPKKLKNLFKSGLTAKDAIKAISPTGEDISRGIGAGIGLEMAEQGEFGPIGTLAAAVIGDVLGGKVSNTIKTGAKIISNPKQALAETAAKFTTKEKKELQKSIINDFRQQGIQADLGTITDSNLIKWTQSRLAQSGLAGKKLEHFRHELTAQIENEYKNISDSLGKYKHATEYEAGTVLKESIKKIRDTELASTRKLYEEARGLVKEKAYVNPSRVNSLIEKIEKDMKPGAFKSPEQSKVLDVLDKLKRDVQDSEGKMIFAEVKDLMNNKIALNDMINYEVQGGAKQLLKGVVGEIDRTIISYGKENPAFARKYITANKQFSEHAKSFRSREMQKILGEGDPLKVLNKMNSVHGIKDLEKILQKSPEGKEIFDRLKKTKLDQIIGDNLIDSTTKQAKLGTFSKLLEKGKNRDLVRQILGKEAFQRLEKLQKNAGKLADASNKFYNASQSGVVAADAAILAKGMSAIANILSGNPWPLMKISGAILGARKLNGLLADPEFLKLVENIILTSEKGGQKELIQSFEAIKPYILSALENSNEEND